MLHSINPVHGEPSLSPPSPPSLPYHPPAPSLRFITGSYDRTCKVWDTGSGEELYTLSGPTAQTGHQNVVYAIAFNNPYG